MKTIVIGTLLSGESDEVVRTGVAVADRITERAKATEERRPVRVLPARENGAGTSPVA